MFYVNTRRGLRSLQNFYQLEFNPLKATFKKMRDLSLKRVILHLVNFSEGSDHYKSVKIKHKVGGVSRDFSMGGGGT